MKEVILSVQERHAGSAKELKLARKSGKIPSVFYGKGIKPESLIVDSKEFLAAIEQYGANVVLSLNFSGGKKAAIVKSLQRDILTQAPIHIDFQAISLTDKVDVKVPIHIDGVADGVKNFGGVMEFIVREVEVKALPTNIPQKINVDVSALGIGQGVTIAALPKLDGVEYVQDPSTLIVHIVSVAVEEEKPADAAVGAEAAQPEVISKGKKDKEGEEGAAAAPAAGAKK
ncbi:50S ribosomal protein L25 [Endomicrobium proavitum]|uniref:Large ribosomal subunit protein bL25 n=1 Tax=Endomicrobium proavitum TaxID=1408281 RepID=A0A0G3WL54_9BACT|nr:50S ribosomal protein L25 [Endomicrobium proavitum]AKL98592.1 50S ribosomal protein L25 [Endomicrobium proavitum]